MTSDTTKANAAQPEAGTAACLFDNWFDPIETGLRARVREFIEALIRGELDAALARPRYGRRAKGSADEVGGVAGHRHGSRTRALTGTFGRTPITVPRARLDGRTVRRRSGAARRCGPTSAARSPPMR
jgi:putative transposase